MPGKKYKNLIIVGLVGGIASGKSLVAEAFARRGAHVIDADRLSHEELGRARTMTRVERAFGSDVFSRGKIDHSKLAEAAFADGESLKRLTDIVHPPVLDAIRRELGRLDSKGSGTVAVLEAALLIESGLDKICDHVIFVSCSLKSRLWRAKKSRRWDPGELRRRERFQLLLKEKKAASTAAVNNNLSPAYTDNAVEKFFDKHHIPRQAKSGRGAKRKKTS
jgi:dephospho-CoA kinase